MALLHTLPVRDGFAMPAEFAPHVGTVLIWPVRPGSWGRDPSAAQRAFCAVIRRLPAVRTSICSRPRPICPLPKRRWPASRAYICTRSRATTPGRVMSPRLL